MSTHAANAPDANKAKTASCRAIVVFRERVAIGSTGAPTQATVTTSKPPSNGYDDPGFTITRTSTGLYAITFPKGRRAWIDVRAISPAQTVTTWNLVAIDPEAGTASFTMLAGTNAAAATDPASGDALLIRVEVEV